MKKKKIMKTVMMNKIVMKMMMVIRMMSRTVKISLISRMKKIKNKWRE